MKRSCPWYLAGSPGFSHAKPAPSGVPRMVLGRRLVGSAIQPGWIRLPLDWRLDAAGDGAPRGCFGGRSDRNSSLRPVLRGPAGDGHRVGAHGPTGRAKRRTPTPFGSVALTLSARVARSGAPSST
jgi:hypothetical protein